MHGKGLSLCRHSGPNWETAMARALYCLGMSATPAEERAMVASFRSGTPHWHGGILFHTEER